VHKYAHFSDDRREIIITRPDTPAPWVNYISNGRYTGLISHTGGGYSFFKSPRDSRITRWRYNSLPPDRPGRYVLLRDRLSGRYWSPTWQPTMHELEQFECRHGLYYTRISSLYDGIAASLLYFVPAEDDLEIWQVTLKNTLTETRHLDLFAFQELALGHALVDLINQPNDQHFNEVRFDRSQEILLASKRYWVTYAGATVKQANQAWDRYAFFASSLPVSGWDGSKERFIGRWRSEANPLAAAEGRCGNSEITSGDAIAALQTELLLKPGEEKRLVFLLGVVPREDHAAQAAAVVNKYRDPQRVDAAYASLRTEWEEYLSHVHVESPDEEMNTLLNVWNPYQTSVTFRFSRDASYHHGGLLFGRGYRDSCQDVLGPVIPRPEWVRARILEMTRFQFRDGSTFHLYYPLSGGGEKTGHSDTPLWLPLAIMTYLKESGDFTLLAEKSPYHDAGEGTVLEHLYAAIDYTLANLTARDLAKFGPGDWNDTLDYLGRGGKGESVWVTMFLCYILRETAELCCYISDPAAEARYREAHARIARAVNTHCWDGAWYIRGTNDLGEVIGSSTSSEGRIFLNTQSWAVISGIAPPERARLCMESVHAHLETPKGPKILHPAYTRIDPNIGLATRCVPGKKENGAVFNHPVSWAILAECLLGHGERAFEIYKKAQPMNPVIDIDRYEVEPYVYAEYVTSPDHPTFGQASHSWLTGSSAWMLRDGIDYILGVRPEYEGLRIDPCIPAAWRSYKVTRRFRGVTFHIRVDNPQGVKKGVRRISLNGQPYEGTLIRIEEARLAGMLRQKSELDVVVEMG